jgi:uncharacterized protein (UPF0332 family)
MSPEAVNYMGIAQALFERGERNFLVEIYEDAAKNAYAAVLNAARAVVFDKLGVAPKTHSGTRTKFFELVHGGLDFDRNVANLLLDGFETKQGIDYGPEITFVSRVQAEDYLRRAERFLAAARAACR